MKKPKSQANKETPFLNAPCHKCYQPARQLEKQGNMLIETAVPLPLLY